MVKPTHGSNQITGNAAGATRRTSELFSPEALQHVFLSLKTNRNQQESTEECIDPIGDHMTDLINYNPCFRFDASCRQSSGNSPHNEHNTNTNEEGGVSGFTFSPLFCRRNMRLLKRFYHQRVKRASLMTIPLSVIGFCYEKSPCRSKFSVTLGASTLLFFSLLAAGLALVLLTSHVVFLWSSYEACFLLIQLSTFLFDWKELAKHCPGVLKLLGGAFIRIGNLMDRHICLRKHFAGREWHQNEFEFEDTLKASSRHTELWNLPPPCVHEAGAHLCLDQRYMARDEWSQATSKHVVAINFCYVMMREEYVRKRARRSTVFHQRSLTPPTEAASTPARNRTCINYECFPTTLPPADVDDEVATHRHVMSISTSLGGVRGLAANSPSGGIELIRANPDSVRPSDPFRMESFAFPVEGTTGIDTGSVPETPTHIKSDSDSCKSSVGSVSSAAVADMNWVDISARIGMRVLNSSHLQRVVASEEAAEHLKKITEQFVVSPQENSGESGVSSPAGLQSLRALSNLDKSTTSRKAKKLPKSPCPPVHSMWTSAAAAGASNDEDDSLDSGGCDWKESKSSDLGDAPTAPPRIIRTSRLPSAIPRRRKQTDSNSASLDIDNTNQLALNEISTDDSGTCEVIRDTILHQKDQSYEVLDSTHLFQFEYNEQCASFSHGASHLEREIHRREPLAPGVKVAAPLFPHQPGLRRVGHSNYQMATVVSSERVLVDHDKGCLSVTCKIDKSFLRNGEFAELTFRVMDEWSSRYMPKHSKVPIGSCVATSYGIGVVVGWRVEDDCHVVRSLWSRRGACAYLRRTAILHVVEAAIGFDVITKCGSGKILGYVNGHYIVTLQDDGVYKNCVVELRRDEIFSCHGAQFRPVIEHIKEACDYQIMLDNYKAILRYQRFDYDDAIKRLWSDNLDILWNSFLNAVQEDTEFDAGFDKFMTGVIEFLERLDRPPIETPAPSGKSNYDASASTSFIGEQRDLDEGPSTGVSISVGPSESGAGQDESESVPGLWLVNDFFGGIFQAPARRTASTHAENTPSNGQGCDPEILGGTSDSYKRAFAVINTLMRTISMARAASVGRPQFRLALSICREFLLFFRTVIKVQRKNTSQSLLVWRNALDEIVSTFGPIKERFERIFRGIAHRMEQQGRKAKIKVLRFADSILGDEIFLNSLCQGEWKQCLLRIEDSMVKAKIIDEASCAHYRKTVRFIYEHVVLLSSKESGAAERNSKKLQYFAKMIQLLASPKRSLLKLLKSDEVLEIFERILVRVFCREKFASRTLTIYSSNYKSLRHLRTLKDLSVSGRLWIPLLDAADEELSYVVSRMPENAKEFMCPLSSIFSLCVAQFHKIIAGNSTKDWLDFLLEDDAVRIIHDLDYKLILWLSSFSRDVQEMMTVLPYYPSIDDDILNLMDEVELDKLLKEASEAIDDAERLSSFIREKTSAAIERFLVRFCCLCLLIAVQLHVLCHQSNVTQCHLHVC